MTVGTLPLLACRLQTLKTAIRGAEADDRFGLKKTRFIFGDFFFWDPGESVCVNEIYIYIHPGKLTCQSLKRDYFFSREYI